MSKPPQKAATGQIRQSNRRMSSVRISVEWIFNVLLQQFNSLDDKNSQKLRQSAVGRVYAVAAILTNLHCAHQVWQPGARCYFDCAAGPANMAEYLA